MKQLIFVTLFVGLVSPVLADGFISGNKLRITCQTNLADYVYDQKHMRCMSYLAGISDAVGGPDKGMNGIKFCFPDMTNQGQLIEIVNNWLNDNPQNGDSNAAILVVKALSDEWPCPK